MSTPALGRGRRADRLHPTRGHARAPRGLRARRQSPPSSAPPASTPRRRTRSPRTRARVPVVFAPNMSVGVNVLLALVEAAARRLGRGLRHRDRRDAPSPQGRRAVGHRAAPRRGGGGRRGPARSPTAPSTRAKASPASAAGGHDRLRDAARRRRRRRAHGHLRRRRRARRAHAQGGVAAELRRRRAARRALSSRRAAPSGARGCSTCATCSASPDPTGCRRRPARGIIRRLDGGNVLRADVPAFHVRTAPRGVPFLRLEARRHDRVRRPRPAVRPGRPAVLALADGTVFRRPLDRRRRPRGRRGRVQHGDDRLPGDPDRSVVRRADRHAHVSAHRQRRRQSPRTSNRRGLSRRGS